MPQQKDSAGCQHRTVHQENCRHFDAPNPLPEIAMLVSHNQKLCDDTSNDEAYDQDEPLYKSPRPFVLEPLSGTFPGEHFNGRLRCKVGLHGQ